jgi:hypothetical protein
MSKEMRSARYVHFAKDTTAILAVLQPGDVDAFINDAVRDLAKDVNAVANNTGRAQKFPIGKNTELSVDFLPPVVKK